MKKFFLSFVLVLFLGATATLVAQPRAIGARLGWGLEVSYQHNLGSNFLEVDAGFYGFSGVHAAVVYDWLIASPSWTSKGTWDFYAGVGGAGGYSFLDGHYGYRYGYVGVAGQIGLSYTFWFPLQLSIDFRPTIGPRFYGNTVDFHLDGFYDVALGVRYSFGK